MILSVIVNTGTKMIVTFSQRTGNTLVHNEFNVGVQGQELHEGYC